MLKREFLIAITGTEFKLITSEIKASTKTMTLRKGLNSDLLLVAGMKKIDT